MLRNIITHPGTGTEIVQEVCQELGAHLHIVTHIKDVYKTAFDGAIMLGGSDIATAFYGESRKYAYNPDGTRDAIEWRIIRLALAERLPVLGICRGHQFLAVASGGSLYQDIKRQTRIAHHGSRHELKNVRRELAKHIPRPHRVNSYHHQAVRTVPFGFDVAARSHDGLIEAIYRPGYLGVQWHPELMVSGDPRWLSLFEWFIRDGLR